MGLTPPGKTVMDLTLVLQYVREVREADLTVSSLIATTLKWNDPRMVANRSKLSNVTEYQKSAWSNAHAIWKPDFFVFNILEFEGRDQTRHK